MPNTHVPAAGEAMPAAEGMRILTGRFSGRAILVGDAAVQMAAAALHIERDAGSIATATAIIHSEEYRVQIDHLVGFVLGRRS